MTSSRHPIVLTDDLLSRALTLEPSPELDELMARHISAALPRTSRQPARRLIWPWTPPLPGLPPQSWRRWRSALGPISLIFLVLLGTIAIVSLMASRPKLPPPFGPARSGLIAFDSNGDIFVVRADGSGRRPLTSGPADDFEPTWSLDGTMIAFWTRPANAGLASLMVIDAEGRDPQTIAKDISSWTPTNHGNSWYGNPPTISWSPDGRTVAFSADVEGRSRLFVAEIDPIRVREVGDRSLDGSNPAWAPDGGTIAFRGEHFDSDRGLYSMEVDGSNVRRLTTMEGTGAGAFVPEWSPDGGHLTFSAGDPKNYDVWVMNADGTHPRDISGSAGFNHIWATWSPDGTRIAWDDGSWNIATPDGVTVVGHAEPVDPTLVWSPDGTQIVGLLQASDSLQDDQIVIEDVNGSSQPRKIPASNIRSATWQRLTP